MEIEMVEAWFANKQDAICVVAGAVSGNLECLDFDNKGELFAAWMERVNTGLLARLVVEQTTSGGYHVLYRTDKPVDGNLKLARGTRGGHKKMTTNCVLLDRWSDHDMRIGAVSQIAHAGRMGHAKTSNQKVVFPRAEI